MQFIQISWGFSSIINLAISGLFFGLLVLFTLQITKKHRSAPTFISMLIFGIIGGIFAFIDSSEIFSIPGRIFLYFQLMCYGFMFLFFYFFLESLENNRIENWRFGIALILLTMQQVALWFQVLFGYYLIQDFDLWVVADYGYDLIAIFVCLFVGLPIYIKSYQYNKEKKPLVFAFALILISLGYVIMFLSDNYRHFGVIPDWLQSISFLTDIFPMLGLIIFFGMYVSNVDYIYRLPFDNYCLLVVLKSGVAIHSVHFENQKNIQIEDQLVSGLISAMNDLFVSTMESRQNIDKISSLDASVLIRTGLHIKAILLTQQVSKISVTALDRYVLEFEKKYHSTISQDAFDLSVYQDANTLIPAVFPFLTIKKEENN